MMKVICEISEWLYKSRIRKILILNGHMWNWGPIYSARENLRYDFPELQVRVLNWWETTPTTMSKLVEDCPVFPSYIHANLSETSCVLAARPELVNMQEAVDEEDYKTFFEYRMDQYSKSGVVGRGATKSTAELGEKLFTMVVDALVPMIKNALNEDKPKSKSTIYENYNNNKNETKKTNQSSYRKKRYSNNNKYSRDVENSYARNIKRRRQNKKL
jgi:creatinine amidohydrolase